MHIQTMRLPLWPKWSNRGRISLLHMNQCNTCRKYIQQTFSDTGQLCRTVTLERRTNRESPTTARTNCRESLGVPLVERLGHQGKICGADYWKWQPTPVFLPRKSHGQWSLAGPSPWGHRVGHDWVTNRVLERGGSYKGRIPDLQSSPEASAKQCIHLRKLPKGGKEPPERNKW